MFGRVPRHVIDSLRAVSLFADCSDAELQSIARLGTPVHVSAGRVLTIQGRPGLEFFVVESGTASCAIDGETVAEFGPGDFFGELALLEQSPRSATVTAESEMELVVFSSTEFRRLLEDGHVVQQMLDTVSARAA